MSAIKQPTGARVEYLDYLRGIAALGIMVYHYMSWTLGDFKADTVIARFGVYGVSIFYILSGLTLYYVYHKRSENTRPFVTGFVKKRLLRILPLLCLAVLFSVFFFGSQPPMDVLLLNLTGLFGFFKWNDALITGGWSIGNEMVFYAFFIVLMILLHRSKALFYMLSAAIFASYLYFAFFILSPEHTLTEQWRDYVNPLNQVFLFLGGILLGLFFQERRLNSLLAYGILLFGILLFCFYPAAGNTITIVTGLGRLVFTLSCLLMCLGVYKLQVTLPAFVHRTLVFFGAISYSLYLLHPIFYSLCGKLMEAVGKNMPHAETLRLALSVSSTVLASHLIYRYYEQFFIGLGKDKAKPVAAAETKVVQGS